MPGKIKIEYDPARFRQTMGGNSDFAQRARAAAGKKMIARMQAVAKDAAARANDYVDANYQRRPEHRKNKTLANQTSLHGSFKAEVIGTPSSRSTYPTFPFEIVLTSSADPLKVHSLNSGSRAHQIGKEGKVLMIPAKGNALRGRTPFDGRTGTERVARPQRFRKSGGAFNQANAGRFRRVDHPVNHPGIRPSYFMELAVEGAITGALRQRVRMKRK